MCVCISEHETPRGYGFRRVNYEHADYNTTGTAPVLLIGFDDDESTRYEIRLSKPVDPRFVYSFLPWPWTTPILSLFAKQAKHVTEKSKRQKVRLRCGSACVWEGSTREGLSATEVISLSKRPQ